MKLILAVTFWTLSTISVGALAQENTLDGMIYPAAAVLCPDGTFVSHTCRLCPDGHFHDSCTLNPEGKFDGNKLCPDGHFHSSCGLCPDGKFGC